MTSEPGSETSSGPQLVIWGTDVVVSQCKEKFVHFITRYIDDSIADDDKFDGVDVKEPYYLQCLDEVGFIVRFN